MNNSFLNLNNGKKFFLLTLLASLLFIVAANAKEAPNENFSPFSAHDYNEYSWHIDFGCMGSEGTFRGMPSAGFGSIIGGGLFFSKYFGVSFAENVSGYRNEHQGLNASNCYLGNIVIRYPSHFFNLTPYVMVGGGAIWNTATQGLGTVGFGLQYRFSKHWALFTSCSWLYGSCNKGLSNIAMPMGGLRYLF